MKPVFVRRNKKAVSPVIGTILMVAITVVLAAVLYVMVSGIGTQQSTQKPNLVLTAGTWNAGNLTVSFASITNAPNLNPVDLTYLIQDPTGITFFTGAAGTGSAVSGTTVTVAYSDNANPNKVSNEDNIRITVSPATSQSIRGGSLKVFFSGDVIGFINQLP